MFTKLSQFMVAFCLQVCYNRFVTKLLHLLNDCVYQNFLRIEVWQEADMKFSVDELKNVFNKDKIGDWVVKYKR